MPDIRIGLCDNDFYELIHIHSKWMLYEEQVAYRKKHNFPSTIDQWIAFAKTRTEAPTANPHKRGPSGEYPLWQDNVECILSVVCKKVSI